MAEITFEQLLEAGAHFGHITRKWNPAMAPYIFMEKNGRHIIDLHKTLAKVDEAAGVMRGMAKSGKKILFVGTKKQVKETIAELAQSVGMPYVVERWSGGMLTNFPTIRKAVKKMVQIDKMKEDGTYDNLSKRERLQVDRQRAKLELNLGSIKDMNRLPSALFVVDVMKEHIAIREAQRLGIPVFAVIDTNANPAMVDYAIPANDDSAKAVELILGELCKAISEGVMEHKAEREAEEAAEAKALEENATAAPRRGRRSRTGAALAPNQEEAAEQATQEEAAPVAEIAPEQEPEA